MQYVSTLRKRTVAVALAGGAILFLAGFSYGYAAPCVEFGARAMTAE